MTCILNGWYGDTSRMFTVGDINLKSKRSIYVCKNIKKGDKFSNLNIKVVRPSMGLHPKYYKKIIGKKVNKNLFAGQRVKLEYIK